MRINKILYVFIGLLALSISLTACGGKEPTGAGDSNEANNTAARKIESFNYEYGSDETGYFIYSVTPEKDGDTVLLSVFSRTDPDRDQEASVKATLIEDLDKLISKNDLVEWDGFDEISEGGVEGYSFDLSITYENGESINAKGYEAYPKDEDDYRQKHDAIVSLLESALDGAETVSPE